MRRALYAAAAVAALAAAFILVAISLPTQPASAMSNGAPQLNCVQCHQDAKNNPAEVEITGIPDKVEPGKEYQIGIKITKGPESKGAAYGGFAFWASDGQLVVVDQQNTFETNSPDGPIITHTKDGSMTREWTVGWKAPDQCNGPITFKIAVIAANGDGTFGGDAYAFKEISIDCVAPQQGGQQGGGEAGGAQGGGQQAVETVTTTSPVGTTTERNPMLAVGVAVLIFIVVVAGYLLFARK